MRKSRIAGLIAVGAISLPLLASNASAVAASPRAPPPIGTQLAELKGSDIVARDGFGISVAISGTTVVVGVLGAQCEHRPESIVGWMGTMGTGRLRVGTGRPSPHAVTRSVSGGVR